MPAATNHQISRSQSLLTSSPAVVERLHDASCLSVVSSHALVMVGGHVTVHSKLLLLLQHYNTEWSLLLLVISASDLPMPAIKFCSFCHKQDSLMHAAAASVSRDQQTQLLTPITYTAPLKYWWQSMVQQWLTPKPDIGQKLHFFVPDKGVPVGILP